MSDQAGSEVAPSRGGAEAFAATVDRTIRAGFGLALKITGSRDAASEVCEAAYIETWRRSRQVGRWDRVEDLAFLARVRAGAVRMRREAAAGTEINLPDLEANERVITGAVDLCHYGRLNAAEAALLLGESPARVRGALRAELLDLAQVADKGNVATPNPD
jgi:hypothetical protein